MNVSSGELLLYWLSHMGEGSWVSFVRAHSELQPPTDERAAYARSKLRRALSELGHAEFFVGGGTRWRVFQPAIGLSPEAGTAALIGGRTPKVLNNVLSSAEHFQCDVDVRLDEWGPDRVLLNGTKESVERSAQASGVRYIPDLALALAAEVAPVVALLDDPTPAAAPRNWSVRSFNLANFNWEDELLPDTAYEYRSRHAPLRHYVRVGRGLLLETERRHAVYLAAHLHRVRLISYDEQARILAAPRTAPLPEAMARVAAACSATPARENGGMLTYALVSPAVAGAVMGAAGQPPPESHWLSDDRSRR